MKNVSSIVKATQRLLDDNSPLILTGAAVVGVVGTAWLTYKGTVQATRRLDHAEIAKRGPEDEEINLDSSLTTQDKFLLTWKFYAPAVVAAVGTSACMVMATKISLNRTAALAGALVIAERGSESYKDRVKELLGEKKHTQVVDSLAEEQVARIPAGYLPTPRDGEQTFIDARTGRNLSTTREKMDKAVNALNAEMLEYTYASLTDFYEKIGLDPVQDSDNVGWNSSRLVKLSYTAVMKDDRAVQVFTFEREPMLDFRDGQI
jgi:hypothetical protein